MSDVGERSSMWMPLLQNLGPSDFWNDISPSELNNHIALLQLAGIIMSLCLHIFRKCPFVRFSPILQILHRNIPLVVLRLGCHTHLKYIQVRIVLQCWFFRLNWNKVSLSKCSIVRNSLIFITFSLNGYFQGAWFIYVPKWARYG